MKGRKEIGLDFEIDKLTNSIENVVTGDSFATEISCLNENDLKTASKKKGWLFNWRDEFKAPAKDVYKLTIVNNPSIIQGLISLEVKSGHVYMHLVESAPFNKGQKKCIPGFWAIWWHSLVNFHFNVGTKEMSLSFRNRSLLSITNGLLAPFILEEE